MRGFNLLHCVLLAFTLLSVYSEFIKAQAFPSTTSQPSAMQSTTSVQSDSDFALCKMCTCDGIESNIKVNCSRRELTSIPTNELEVLASAGQAVSTM